MARQRYQLLRFADETLKTIDTINAIISEFSQQGFIVTLRQLYYQLVARDLFPDNRRWRRIDNNRWVKDPQGTKNAEPNYKWLGNIVNDGKVAGLIDWDAMEDRTREFIRRQRWKSGKDILAAVVKGFHMDMWSNQPARPFVVIEKDALAGVLAPTCHALDVPLLAAKGYPSGSALREFAIQDIMPFAHEQRVVIVHLGDHDPSGLDMTRDLRERVEMFAEAERYGFDVEVRRIALNMDQIKARKPPPNPAKVEDPRAKDYIRDYGTESWELDALPPAYLAKLVRDEISECTVTKKWKTRNAEVNRIRSALRKLVKNFKS
jgi:hypothetical protein